MVSLFISGKFYVHDIQFYATCTYIAIGFLNLECSDLQLVKFSYIYTIFHVHQIFLISHTAIYLNPYSYRPFSLALSPRFTLPQFTQSHAGPSAWCMVARKCKLAYRSQVLGNSLFYHPIRNSYHIQYSITIDWFN